MAYYDVLTAAWNNPTQPPPGVTGVGLTVQMTTQEKLNHVNAWTVVGSIPTSFYVTGDRLFNCIDRTEFFALTAAQQQNLLLMMNTPGPLLGGSGSTNHLAAGMILVGAQNDHGWSQAHYEAGRYVVEQLRLPSDALIVEDKVNGLPSPFVDACNRRWSSGSASRVRG
jgi:hypothetical protein